MDKVCGALSFFGSFLVVTVAKTMLKPYLPMLKSKILYCKTCKVAKNI